MHSLDVLFHRARRRDDGSAALGESRRPGPAYAGRGFSGLLFTETGRTAYLNAAVASQAAPGLELLTGVAVAFPRSPFVTAATAWELQEATGGVVGNVRITRVVEFVIPFPVDFFAEATPEDVAAEAWLAPEFVDADGMYLMSLHTFVVESDGLRILVDTCTGNAKDRPLIPEFDHQNRPFLENLTAAGFAPDTIDIVVCTHLHVDHVGWNTRLVNGEWIPTFPRARYLFGAADIDCWAHSEDGLLAPAFADSVQPVIDAGQVETVAADTALTRDVELRRTQGHTPGHMSVWISDRCLITGDVLHHPIQCGHPDWTARGDLDPDMARATRRRLLADAARRMPLYSVPISPAPLPGASSQSTTATASCPKPTPDMYYDYAGTPAVTLRECVIRVTTESTADRRPGTNASDCMRV